jgi:hypothetical protein
MRRSGLSRSVASIRSGMRTHIVQSVFKSLLGPLRFCMFDIDNVWGVVCKNGMRYTWSTVLSVIVLTRASGSTQTQHTYRLGLTIQFEGVTTATTAESGGCDMSPQLISSLPFTARSWPAVFGSSRAAGLNVSTSLTHANSHRIGEMLYILVTQDLVGPAISRRPESYTYMCHVGKSAGLFSLASSTDVSHALTLS